MCKYQRWTNRNLIIYYALFLHFWKLIPRDDKSTASKNRMARIFGPLNIHYCKEKWYTIEYYSYSIELWLELNTKKKRLKIQQETHSSLFLYLEIIRLRTLNTIAFSLIQNIKFGFLAQKLRIVICECLNPFVRVIRIKYFLDKLWNLISISRIRLGELNTSDDDEIYYLSNSAVRLMNL